MIIIMELEIEKICQADSEIWRKGKLQVLGTVEMDTTKQIDTKENVRQE